MMKAKSHAAFSRRLSVTTGRIEQGLEISRRMQGFLSYLFQRLSHLESTSLPEVICL